MKANKVSTFVQFAIKLSNNCGVRHSKPKIIIQDKETNLLRILRLNNLNIIRISN